MNTFTLEKRRRLLKDPFFRFWLASVSLALLAGLLAACGTPGAEASNSITPIPALMTATPLNLETPTPPVPMIEVGGLQIPDPHVSNPELFDVTKPDSPIVQFANAFGVTPQEVGELTPELKTAVDGTQFAVLTIADLPQTADFDESGTPLMIAEQGENGEWNWSEATFTKIIANQYGINIGTTVDGSENYHDSRYHNLLNNQFNLFMTNRQIMPFVVDQWGWDGGREARNLADKNNLILQLHPGFYPRFFPESLSGANKEAVDKYIDERITNLLSLVRKTDDGYQPTYLNFANEAVWLSNNKVGWYSGGANPLFQYYGEDWLAEIYVKIYEQAQQRNLEIGKDIVMIYNESELTSSTEKANFVHTMLTTTKNTISQRLNIPLDSVQLDVGVQLHLSNNQEDYKDGYISIPTEENLLETIKLFADIGSVHLTEFDLKGASNEDKLEIFSRVIIEAYRSNNVKSIGFWNTLRFNGDPNSVFDYGPNDLFSFDYQPTSLYYVLLSKVLNNLSTP
jgi:GH35 family endo-1,4-beta-xylanase